MRINSTANTPVFLLLKNSCHQVTERATREAQQTVGVHGTQALALLLLDSIEPCSASELADQLGINRPATSTLLQRLETGGFVQRTESTSDGRSSEVSLTKAGSEIAAKTAHFVEDVSGRLTAGFNRDEQEVITRFLLGSPDAIG